MKLFNRQTEPLTGNYGGSGLGLSISNDLAKLLGGFISMESKEEKGREVYSRFICPLKPIVSKAPILFGDLAY
ncbi:ATP-binding protein [Paenibacillus sp.]|uniref:ATP-binding protein n=1 Tax=Paenibacillus sp. TaxID=58172 RepID=UPI0037C71BBB